ncbi:MAG: NHLP bacteriocin system secretion protein [Francisellaceae bacterium]
MVKKKHHDSTSNADQTSSFTLIPFRKILLLIFFFILLFIFLIWSLSGTIDSTVKGKGVILSGTQYRLYNVTSQGDGTINKLLIFPGKHVIKGEIIATLSTPVLNQKIKNQRHYIEKLSQQKESLTALFEKKTKAADHYYQLLEKDQHSKEIYTKEYENYLLKLLKDLDQLYKKGYITLPEFETYRQEYYTVRNALQLDRDSQFKFELIKYQTDIERDSALERMTLNLMSAENTLNNLLTEKKERSQIIAPHSGLIISVLSAIGKYVKTGESIANISPQSSSRFVFALFEASNGKKLQPGMSAYISPDYINPYQYGRIHGSVIRISSYPLSSLDILAQIHNPSWLALLGYQNQAMFLALIKLDTNSNTYSGLSWTSGEGPDNKITPGSFAEISVTVKKQAPISLALPVFKWLFHEDKSA